MDPTAQLLAIEDIKQLKARYFRFMDCKDWDGMLGVFTPDAQFDLTGSWSTPDLVNGGWSPPFDESLKVSGRSDFVNLLKNAIGPLHTVHHGHMPEITILSEVDATGIWAMEDLIRNPEDQPYHCLHAYGHYHERYAKSPNGWAISEMRLTRLFFSENKSS